MTSEYIPAPGYSPERVQLVDDQNIYPSWSSTHNNNNMTPKYGYHHQQQPRKPLGDANQNLQPDQQPHAASFAALKSPTTLCFERMLGAAASIATPRDIAARKKATMRNNRRPVQLPPTLLDGVTTEDDENLFEPVPVAVADPPFVQDEEEQEEEEDEENPFHTIQRDPVLFKKLVLTMALQRQPKEAKESETLEVPPPIISEGFYWKDYPQCEALLYDSMARYYELSKSSRQSKEQQAFNNQLVSNIRNVASENGYTFDASYFNDKRLRDRIRCFFKTHLQNAKKRLNTMQKHPDSLENQHALRALIRLARSRMLPEEVQQTTVEDLDEEEYRPEPKRRRSR